MKSEFFYPNMSRRIQNDYLPDLCKDLIDTILEYLLERVHWQYAEYVIKSGAFILYHDKMIITGSALTEAAKYGNLEIFQSLYTRSPRVHHNVLEELKKHNHLHILDWIHINTKNYLVKFY